MQNLPSASGIEILDNRMFVISDNTPWLYELDREYVIKDTISIAPKNNLQGEVFDKDTKFDFEGIACFRESGKDHLLIFGSGSKSIERNKLVWLTFNDSISSETFDLTGFYQHILKSSQLEKEDFNLEGVGIVNDKLYLFNRGNNTIWKFALAEFIDFLNYPHTFPDFTSYEIHLPMHKGVQAGFSGASESKEDSKIIFTASLEDTENWVDDGEVLGSFIGLIELDSLKDNYQPTCYPLTTDGEMLKLKVESVAIKSMQGNSYQLLLVTDSDGEGSELLEADLYL